jgi:hypothetical protein
MKSSMQCGVTLSSMVWAMWLIRWKYGMDDKVCYGGWVAQHDRARYGGVWSVGLQSIKLPQWFSNGLSNRHHSVFKYWTEGELQSTIISLCNIVWIQHFSPFRYPLWELYGGIVKRGSDDSAICFKRNSSLSCPQQAAHHIDPQQPLRRILTTEKLQKKK